jgi:hypothetical protein
VKGIWWLGNACDSDGAEPIDVSGICLCVIRYLLTWLERAESCALYGGKMDKHISASVFVGNKSKSFFLVKPLYCTMIHVENLLKSFDPKFRKEKPPAASQNGS